MFRLSKGAEYAILGLIYMASKATRDFSDIDEISRANSIPRPYLAKLFRMLASRGLVTSFRGREGGFLLARPTAEITLLDIVEAIEGPVLDRGAAEAPGGYASPVQSVIKECIDDAARVLESYSLEGLTEKVSGYKGD